MKTWVKYILLAVVMLMYAGCSNHPPSAAQFMNVKEDEGDIVIGGTAKIGDLHRGKNRLQSDYSDVELFGDLDVSLLFRYSHLVLGLYSENLYSISGLAGSRWEYVGVQGWFGLTFLVVDKQVPIYGGLMLIEEYPVSENLRVGLSEHISRNAHGVDKNEAGLGSPATGFYHEFGAGIYLAYKDFSAELRYGREIDEPRNRFYLMVNYAFDSDG